MSRNLLTINDLVPIINRSASWLYKNHKRLSREEKFPQPLKGVGLLWDPLAIENWQNTRIPSYLKTNDNKTGTKKNWDIILAQKAANL